MARFNDPSTRKSSLTGKEVIALTENGQFKNTDVDVLKDYVATEVGARTTNVSSTPVAFSKQFVADGAIAAGDGVTLFRDNANLKAVKLGTQTETILEDSDNQRDMNWRDFDFDLYSIWWDPTETNRNAQLAIGDTAPSADHIRFFSNPNIIQIEDVRVVKDDLLMIVGNGYPTRYLEIDTSGTNRTSRIKNRADLITAFPNNSNPNIWNLGSKFVILMKRESDGTYSCKDAVGLTLQLGFANNAVTQHSVFGIAGQGSSNNTSANYRAMRQWWPRSIRTIDKSKEIYALSGITRDRFNRGNINGFFGGERTHSTTTSNLGIGLAISKGQSQFQSGYCETLFIKIKNENVFYMLFNSFIASWFTNFHSIQQNAYNNLTRIIKTAYNDSTSNGNRRNFNNSLSGVQLDNGLDGGHRFLLIAVDSQSSGSFYPFIYYLIMKMVTDSTNDELVTSLTFTLFNQASSVPQNLLNFNHPVQHNLIDKLFKTSVGTFIAIEDIRWAYNQSSPDQPTDTTPAMSNAHVDSISFYELKDGQTFFEKVPKHSGFLSDAESLTDTSQALFSEFINRIMDNEPPVIAAQFLQTSNAIHNTAVKNSITMTLFPAIMLKGVTTGISTIKDQKITLPSPDDALATLSKTFFNDIYVNGLRVGALFHSYFKSGTVSYGRWLRYLYHNIGGTNILTLGSDQALLGFATNTVADGGNVNVMFLSQGTILNNFSGLEAGRIYHYTSGAQGLNPDGIGKKVGLAISPTEIVVQP